MGFSLKNAIGSAIGGFSDAFLPGSGEIVRGAVGLGEDDLRAEENWKWQKKASDYAFNQNLQMWNLQNAYNDPAAQMERLQKAGLNPNLVYGGGNVTGNTSGSAPTYERPNVGFSDRSTQRAQLALALREHQQRITNQAIENDLARQRLVLAEREANRSDALAMAHIESMKHTTGLRSEKSLDMDNYYDDEQKKLDNDYNMRLKEYHEALKDWEARRSAPDRILGETFGTGNRRPKPPVRYKVHRGGMRVFGKAL